MIFVNDPGLPDGYWQLRHTFWNGLSFADLIFPAFLFVVGVSLVFSVDRRLERGASRRDLMLVVIRRSLILFALGLVYNGFPLIPWHRLRLMNALQRIALCYLAAASLYMFASAKARWSVVGAVLVGYWVLLRVWPANAAAGWLTPEGNLASSIDRWILAGHMLRPDFDPEGLLSTLPAIATTLFGVFAGSLLRSKRSLEEKAARLAAGGAGAFVAGLLWSVWFPINKPVWTSSFCLVTAGVAACALAALMWLVELRGARRWTVPFAALGASAIVAYFLSEGFFEFQKRAIVARPGGGMEQLRIRLCEALFGGWLSPKAASFAYSLMLCLFWLAFFTVLSRRRRLALHV